MQEGAFHRMRLHPAAIESGGPSTPAVEGPGRAHYARLALAAQKDDHRRANAAETAPRIRSGSSTARVLIRDMRARSYKHREAA